MLMILTGKPRSGNECGVSLVPGDVALPHESGQNSAALKNITRTLGNTTTAKHFNTAIEYDTDAARTAYSRIKHYINQGEAISYEYDTAGNISKITNPDGSYVTYTYDALNQLLSEEYSSAVNLPHPMYGSSMDGMQVVRILYTYDARGNLLSKDYIWPDGTSYVERLQYTDAVWNDRVTKIGNTTITYDEIGNPLNWTDNATLTWEHGRQLASFTRGNTVVSYTYNDEGIRTSKTIGDVTTNYNVIDGSLRSLSDGTNTLQFFEKSVYFNNVEYWYVYNAQNDVIGLINADGEYVVEYTYSAYGLPLSKTGSMADTLGTLNPFRYRGYIYDEETGLYYCNSRYYDPSVGRFINADNEALATTTPEVPHWDKNLYAYCDNNPMMRMDETGEVWSLAGIITGAAIGAVTSFASTLFTGGSMKDALVSAGIGAVSGALSSLGIVGRIIGGVITGIGTGVYNYMNGATWGTSLATGLTVGVISTFTIGYGIDKFTKAIGVQNVSTAVSAAVDLTYGFSSLIIASAVSTSILLTHSPDKPKKTTTVSKPALYTAAPTRKPNTGIFGYVATSAYTVRY